MPKKNKKAMSLVFRCKDNNSARLLFGPQSEHLSLIEEKLAVKLQVRGGDLNITGEEADVQLTYKLVDQLYSLVKKDYPLVLSTIDRSIKTLQKDPNANIQKLYDTKVSDVSLKKEIRPLTEGQKKYLEAIQKYDIVFGVGPAGTGKTYVAIAMAVMAYVKGEVHKIILTRPAIEAGEKLGFLPGDLVEKVNPYLRPLYDALYDLLGFEKVQKMIDRSEIEVAPLAFMRGRTLSRAFVILDESQNCTKGQMKMFLTRLGPNSKCVVTGDITQIDLPDKEESGLVDAIKILKRVKQICFHYFESIDVVRHQLVQDIINAYDQNAQESEDFHE